MPVNLQLTFPPAFDKSIVPAFSTNFNRIRDAFQRTFGGDYLTGTHTEGFVGITNKGFNILFSPTFQQAIAPIVIACAEWQAAEQYDINIGTVDQTFFSVWAKTISGAPSTENLQIRWVAFYP